MKRSNFILDLLFLLGLPLMLGAFLVFVPPELRTKTAWLDFAVAVAIYIGIFGHYTILFRPLSGFADSAPFISAYWKSFGSYTVFAISCMIWGGRIGMAFEKQLLIQIALLFLFFLGVAVGFWFSEWHTRSTIMERQTMDPIRAIQRAAAEFQSALEYAPDSFRGCRKLYEELTDELISMSGVPGGEAQQIERQLLDGLLELGKIDLQEIAPDELAKRIHSLTRLAARRKVIR